MSKIKVIIGLGESKNYGVEFTKKPTKNSVARILNEDDELIGFISMVADSSKSVFKVDPSKFYLEPLLPANKKSTRTVISGESDTGKTTLASLFLDQYSLMYPDNELFFISEKNKDIDRNLSKLDDLVQLTKEDLQEFDINDYPNSMFLVDDSDSGKDSKLAMSILNSLSMVGREYNISYIFISHYNSRLDKTKAFSEFQTYITYYDNITENNLMLKNQLGFTNKQIQEFKAMKATYYIFNKIYNILVTNKGVIKYR